MTLLEVIMSSFDMTPTQSDAFKAATDGVSALTFDHFVLFMIGGLATIWLLLVFLGTVKNEQKSIYSAMYEFSFGVAIYITIGIIIYYT